MFTITALPTFHWKGMRIVTTGNGTTSLPYISETGEQACSRAQIQYGHQELVQNSYDRVNADNIVGLPGRRRYNAAPRLDSLCKPSLSFANETGVLSVHGFVVDTIEFNGGATFGGWKDRNNDPVLPSFWRTIIADRTTEEGNPPTGYGRACEYSFRLLAEEGHIDTAKLIRMTRSSSCTKDFLTKVQNTVWNRAFFMTRGWECLGLGPAQLAVGDKVCIIYGCSVPVILRPVKTYFKFIGECFVHGMMEGEAIKGLNQVTETNFLVH